jgi:energy-coupling factor transporter transmembrane protein EcfT
MNTDVGHDANWSRRALWVGGGLVVLVLVILGASATVPRWWAHRVGAQVDGSITQGTFLGLVYGFVFTFLPIIVFVLILRWRRTWKTLVFALVVALLLAAPNLMTLSIVVGTGNAAHAGDRVLDVEAPAFRGGTLAGALVAALAFVLIAYLAVSRDRAHSTARSARKERDEARAPAPSVPPNDPDG